MLKKTIVIAGLVVVIGALAMRATSAVGDRAVTILNQCGARNVIAVCDAAGEITLVLHQDGTVGWTAVK